MLSDEEKRLIYEGRKEEPKKEESDEDKEEKKDQQYKKSKNTIRRVDYYIIALLLIILILTAGFHILFYYYYQTKAVSSPIPVPPSSSYTLTIQGNPAPQVPSDGYKLKLLEWHWVIEQGYAIVEGEVQNISSAPLTNVNAVASFYDSNKRLIKSAENIIAYSPILAGQISLFRVKTLYSPDIANASIDFKYLNGENIPVQRLFQANGM